MINIDFSLNSPGFYIKTESTQKWVSIINTSKISKKELKLLDEVKNCSDVDVYEQENYITSDKYINSEFDKLIKHRELAKQVVNVLKQYINPDDDLIFNFEGFSYSSSNTSALLDIVAATTLLKNELFDAFPNININVFAPTTIKKHVSKGNMKKREIWDFFIKSEDEDLINSDFHKLCKSIEMPKSVYKPFDDLVDSYYICKTAMNEIKKEND